MHKYNKQELPRQNGKYRITDISCITYSSSSFSNNRKDNGPKGYKMIIKGTVHKYNRANIDTDVIIPGPYLKIHDHEELAKHAMEGLDPQFPFKVAQGDFLVTGSNF